jgi:hypothetical protein
MSVKEALENLGTQRRRRRSRDAEARSECLVETCGKPTTGKKPYCLDHLDHLPYVQWLSAEIHRRRSKAGDAGSGTAEDLIEHLAVYGETTVGRLSREVQVPKRSLESCVHKLEREGIVETKTIPCRRGRSLTVVRLTPAHPFVTGQTFQDAPRTKALS